MLQKTESQSLLSDLHTQSCTMLPLHSLCCVCSFSFASGRLAFSLVSSVSTLIALASSLLLAFQCASTKAGLLDP